MPVREWAIQVMLSFELNKFWDDDDPELDHIEKAHQDAFFHFTQDVLLDDPTLEKSTFWHKIAFNHAIADIWFHFFCVAEDKDVAEALANICAEKAAKRMEEFGAHLKQIELKT